MKLKEIARKLATKNVKEVLEQIKGQDIESIGDTIFLKDNIQDGNGKRLGKTLLNDYY
jgi:hypothetical protein